MQTVPSDLLGDAVKDLLIAISVSACGYYVTAFIPDICLYTILVRIEAWVSFSFKRFLTRPLLTSVQNELILSHVSYIKSELTHGCH